MHGIQREIELQNIHMRFTENSQHSSFGLLSNQPAQHRLIQAARPGNTGHLKKRRGGRDIRIQAAGGAGYQIDRNRRRRIFRMKGRGIFLDARDQRFGGWAKVGCGGVARIIRRRGGGRAAMKIFGRCEILTDEFGADDFSIVLARAAIGLMGKQQLRDACHAERIDETGADREQHDQHDGGADMFQHGAILRQGRWR